MIEGLREYAAKQNAKATLAAAEIIPTPVTPAAGTRARSPISTRVAAETLPAAEAETVGAATPKAIEAPVQKVATPKLKEEAPVKATTPKTKIETPKKTAEVAREAIIALPEAESAPTRRRSIRTASPIACEPAPAQVAVEPPTAVEVIKTTDDSMPSGPTSVPAFVWAPFKEDGKVARDDASDSSAATASSASDSERILALKSKAKPALAHKVLNKLKSPIKKARSPIRVAAPRPPVPTAVAKAPVVSAAGSKAPARATNMPNFEKLHSKEFARRESLNSFQKRQTTTAKAPVAPVAPRTAAPVSAPVAPAPSASKANVSFVAAVPSTPQQKRRLSKPATPFTGASEADAASSSADERSTEQKAEASRVAVAARPPQATAVPKRPTVAAPVKKPKFDLQASLAKGALPYKAAVSNAAPRVLKENVGAAAAPIKRAGDAAINKSDEDSRKKMRASLAVNPAAGSARRLSTVN